MTGQLVTFDQEAINGVLAAGPADFHSVTKPKSADFGPDGEDAWFRVDPESPMGRALRQKLEQGFTLEVSCLDTSLGPNGCSETVVRDKLPDDFRDWVLWEVAIWGKDAFALSS